MSEYSEFEHLKLICEKIDIIFEICECGITAALDDYKLKRPAILMHLQSCQQELKKLDKSNFDLTEIISHDDFKGFADTRNFIAHDYDGVSLPIIENVIRRFLPGLKENIQKILKKRCKN
ncbi:MAG: DUF86 domain-containing protein [Campylobacter sp.]|nr:DUF86 domain-containing protein [Campylobacter sp.]